MRAQIDAVPKFEKRQRELERQHAAADEVLRKADERHTETVVPLESELRAIANRIAQSHHAQTELLRTCQGANLLRRRDELNARQRDAIKESDGASRELERKKGWLAHTDAEAEPEKYTTYRGCTTRCKETLAGLRALRDRLQGVSGELCKQMLIP